MAKKPANAFWSKSLQRTLTSLTRTALRAGTKAVKQSLRAAPKVRKAATPKRAPSPPPRSSAAHWHKGIAIGPRGARGYHLYKPPGVRRTERLALMVMLHGCGQDGAALAASSQMNRIAARERFMVLYPEQDRLANAQGCWNWFDTRSGRAQREADSIDAAIDQVCLLQPVDSNRIALAGISAGASTAALMAVRHPGRYRAVAMHSGIAPGAAQSSATALSAMRGRRSAPPLPPRGDGEHLPALLVIQGTADPVVAPGNGAAAAHVWATREEATPGIPRTVQRGARYAANVTDYKNKGRLVATLCLVSGLGHAWSGGAAGKAFSDPKGPDASKMIWSFAAKQFAIGPTRKA
jgi:poly(hydroxyalkanoate) depolymerase family esterase